MNLAETIYQKSLKRDGVCNPVTHVLKAIEVFKRFGRIANPDRHRFMRQTIHYFRAKMKDAQIVAFL